MRPSSLFERPIEEAFESMSMGPPLAARHSGDFIYWVRDRIASGS